MVHPHEKQIDRFTQDFDSLIDDPQSAGTETMANLSLVKGADCAVGPFDLDLTLEHTTDHADCPACQAANQALQINAGELARMHFTEAAKLWPLIRAQSDALKPRTHETTRNYLRALGKFFGHIRLCDITPGHIRGYQIARKHNLMRIAGADTQPWKRPAGDSIINHEICALGMIMTHAKLWHRIKPYYFPKSTPSWSPREILTEEQEEELWKVAARHPEAALAYWVATITNNTSAAGIELRGLKLKNLYLREAPEISEIYINEDSVKNESRPRKIPLNNEARWAVAQCFKRALQLGSHEPDHYLFPFRVRGNAQVGTYDPTRPPSRWFLRNSWEKLRAATGFVDLNPHDLRHHCITRLLENDQNPETVISIAGHVGRKMLEYYAHQRRRVKYAAVLAISAKKKPVTSEKASSLLDRRIG